ncbi:MAG: plasmid stabilization protein [Nitrospira sp. LK265]|nr:type II toxin-antitoxin system RelE/ParE family toxin [Nitrospira sp.]NGZ60849.1 plasmid stabilization protein [Nitrospira sp. LK265]
MAEERREVIWTTSARNELDDIVTYIAKDAPLSALAFLEEVLNTADSLATLSKRGRIVPEYQNPLVRELFIKHYRLLYEIQDHAVYVLGFIHGARDFKPDEVD